MNDLRFVTDTQRPREVLAILRAMRREVAAGKNALTALHDAARNVGMVQHGLAENLLAWATGWPVTATLDWLDRAPRSEALTVIDAAISVQAENVATAVRLAEREEYERYIAQHGRRVAAPVAAERLAA